MYVRPSVELLARAGEAVIVSNVQYMYWKRRGWRQLQAVTVTCSGITAARVGRPVAQSQYHIGRRAGGSVTLLT